MTRKGPKPLSALPSTKGMNQPNGRSANRLNQPIALFLTYLNLLKRQEDEKA
jgi:hypothetical protein